MRLLPILFIVAITGGAWHHFSTRAVSHGEGVTAPDDPVQIDLPPTRAFATGNYQITPLAKFSIEARVLGSESYRLGREAELSPLDLALGWGPMSDTAVISRLNISQSGRFYHYSWPDQPPISAQAIVEHSANMHMIPATAEVEKQLKAVRVGQVVRLSGYLVRADAQDGWRWISSLTRTDSGSGACELVWVEGLDVQ